MSKECANKKCIRIVCCNHRTTDELKLFEENMSPGHTANFHKEGKNVEHPSQPLVELHREAINVEHPPQPLVELHKEAINVEHPSHPSVELADSTKLSNCSNEGVYSLDSPSNGHVLTVDTHHQKSVEMVDTCGYPVSVWLPRWVGVNIEKLWPAKGEQCLRQENSSKSCLSVYQSLTESLVPVSWLRGLLSSERMLWAALSVCVKMVGVRQREFASLCDQLIASKHCVHTEVLAGPFVYWAQVCGRLYLYTQVTGTWHLLPQLASYSIRDELSVVCVWVCRQNGLR